MYTLCAQFFVFVSSKHVFAVCVYVDLCVGGAAISSDGGGYNENEEEEEELETERKREKQR